jgi:hypothetical protein
VRNGQQLCARQLIDFPHNCKPVPFGGSQQLLEKSGWREEKTARKFAATRQSGQQLPAENGAEPRAFAQGSLRQRIYSLEVVAEGGWLKANLLYIVFNWVHPVEDDFG